MSTESVNDAFERRYMGKFQETAAKYGVVVKYDRDRAARDIGVHFFRPTSSGDEVATGSLVWFQMKGLRTITLSKEAFENATHIPISLKVKHLQLWYRMNGPTYLAVYVESADLFLVLNPVKYVKEKFGIGILTLEQKTVYVPVSTESVLDAQALSLIIRDGTVEEWARVLSAEAPHARLAHRDYGLLWRLHTAHERGVEHQINVQDWQTKMRGEISFFERPIGGTNDTWQAVRNHMEVGLGIEELEQTYPYLSFEPFDQETHDEIEFLDNYEDKPTFTFSDGTAVYGTDHRSEFSLYELRPRINLMGQGLITTVETLIRAGMIESPDLNESDWLSVAPWHVRDI